MYIKTVTLNYDFEIFLTADYDADDTVCLFHIVQEQEEIYRQYGGFPKSFNPDNTRIHQLFWSKDQVDFDLIGKQLGIEVVSISSIRQDPGCILPAHKDQFYKINQTYPSRSEVKVRANIFLEDWKMGHFLQYNDYVISNWANGTGLMWDSDILHLSANAGLEPKFTLQVSGFLLNAI
jgi:hypothetical protein